MRKRRGGTFYIFWLFTELLAQSLSLPCLRFRFPVHEHNSNWFWCNRQTAQVHECNKCGEIDFLLSLPVLLLCLGIFLLWSCYCHLYVLIVDSVWWVSHRKFYCLLVLFIGRDYTLCKGLYDSFSFSSKDSLVRIVSSCISLSSVWHANSNVQMTINLLRSEVLLQDIKTCVFFSLPSWLAQHQRQLWFSANRNWCFQLQRLISSYYSLAPRIPTRLNLVLSSKDLLLSILCP